MIIFELNNKGIAVRAVIPLTETQSFKAD